MNQDRYTFYKFYSGFCSVVCRDCKVPAAIDSDEKEWMLEVATISYKRSWGSVLAAVEAHEKKSHGKRNQ